MLQQAKTLHASQLLLAELDGLVEKGCQPTEIAVVMALLDRAEETIGRALRLHQSSLTDLLKVLARLSHRPSSKTLLGAGFGGGLIRGAKARGGAAYFAQLSEIRKHLRNSSVQDCAECASAGEWLLYAQIRIRGARAAWHMAMLAKSGLWLSLGLTASIEKRIQKLAKLFDS